MTRLASIAKAGFYPTPDRVTQWIAQNVVPSTTGGKLLDPCAGEGVAAALVAHTWGLDAYGIELDTQRAKAASHILKRVLHLDYQLVRIPHGAFQVHYLNPPYESGAPALDPTRAASSPKRLAMQFLRDTTKYLQPGGLLVYLVPQHSVDARMVNFLAAWYDAVQVFRFPDPEFAAFKQVVVFGVAKAAGRKDDAAGLALAEACRGELAVLPESGLGYTIPSADPNARFYFRGNRIDPAEALAEAQRIGVETTREWVDWLNPPTHRGATFQPLVPFKKGHLASVIAAGLMQNLRLDRGTERLLVKGYTLKEREEVPTDDENKTIVRDRFVTEVVVLNLDSGEATRLTEPTEFAAFIEQWRDVLTKKVVQDFKPLYNFDLAEEGKAVNAVLDRLSKGRVVAGRSDTGLFVAQKHTTAALRKRLLRANYALCVGEPGVGKTTIATSVAALLREINGDPRPTLVLCPPHLTPKWKREIEEIIPGAQAFILKRLVDVRAFVEHVDAHPETPLFAVVSREMAKLGSGWAPAYVVRKKYERLERVVNKKRVLAAETDEYLACPDCGAPVMTDDGSDLVVRDPAYLSSRKRKCAVCGATLYQTSAKNMMPRFPLAEYIAKKLKGVFGLFVSDEIHQLKGQSTDQGYALGALVRACEKTLALTGTIYGGKSTSLFYLLHRLSPQVRQEFAWSDGQKWAEKYGVLERITKVTESDNGYGHYSGRRRTSTNVRELPGVSPELVTRLLDSAVFLNLSDLGYTLPGYIEIPHEIEMASDQRDAYDQLEREFQMRARQAWQDGDHSLIGQFVQALLGYPNRCVAAESITDMTGQVVASAPALSASVLYPKEQWLVDTALEARDRGRKVLVFCRQTDTRDITARLKTLLENAGLRAAVLLSSVPTDKREAWLAAKAPQIDVLAVNPKCIDTGLDAVQFATCVWYESEASLYVLMQATKRIYRVGQVDDVEVHFATYAQCAEHRAVALTRRKWAAAQLLYGESIEGALAQAVDTGSFLAELTKSTINHAKIDDLNTLFRRSQTVRPKRKLPTLPVIPVPIAPSPTTIPVSVPTPLPAGSLVQLSLF